MPRRPPAKKKLSAEDLRKFDEDMENAEKWYPRVQVGGDTIAVFSLSTPRSKRTPKPSQRLYSEGPYVFEYRGDTRTFQSAQEYMDPTYQDAWDAFVSFKRAEYKDIGRTDHVYLETAVRLHKADRIEEGRLVPYRRGDPQVIQLWTGS